MKKRVALLAVALLAGAAFFFVRGPSTPPRWDVATQEPALLARALALSPYRAALVSQNNPSVCGPASVDNVARSIGASFENPCLFGFCIGGLTLDALAEAAARSPKWTVTVLRGLTLEQFRDELSHVSDPSRRYVVDFHRGPIFSGGGGHHSPIGAFVDDQVLVLDVNSRYGPWLVPAAKLFEAMDTVDSSSGRKRGLLRFELK